jgi:transposase-like protein
VYLYQAVDSTGATSDFPLSAKRDAAAAERFLAKPWVEKSIQRREDPRTAMTKALTGKPSYFAC